MESNNIDKLFQKKIEDLEVDLPSEIWDAIEAKLRKRKKIRFWLFFGVSLISLLAILIGFSEKKLPKNIQKNQPVTKELNKKPVEKKITNYQTVILKNKKESDIDSLKIKSSKKRPFAINVKDKKRLVKSSIKDRTPKENKAVSRDRNTKSSLEKLPKKEKQQITNKEFHPQEKSKNLDSLNTSTKTKEILKKKEKQQSKKEKNVTEKEKATKGESNWEIYPVFGVLNSGTFSNTASIIDARFNENSLSTEITFSYGFSSIYKLNKKWSIRWGIHFQELSYTTKDVFLTNIVSGNNLSNVTYTPGVFVRFLSSNTNVSSGGEVQNAILKQTYGYLELPLEIRYNIYNNSKFNTNIVTGFSSLYLHKNEISAQSNLFSGKVGKANNIKSISFSANIGLDIDYFINKKWIFSVSPMFKKQFNTFSGNTNGFNPYYIGIYSGIKYQF